jgi:hypothetical protein
MEKSYPNRIKEIEANAIPPVKEALAKGEITEEQAAYICGVLSKRTSARRQVEKLKWAKAYNLTLATH